MKILTHDDVLHRLRKEQGDSSLREFAKKIGISAAYLSDILRRQREPGKKVMRLLGIEKTRTFTVTYFEAANGKAKK